MKKEVCQRNTQKVSHEKLQKYKHFYELEGEIQ